MRFFFALLQSARTARLSLCRHRFVNADDLGILVNSSARVVAAAFFCCDANDGRCQFISDAVHEKASSLLVESVTQGCTAWLRFEPDVVALSILLLAIARAESRENLITRVSCFALFFYFMRCLRYTV